ncbi:hypothetical protein GGI43DRAFT_8481 [Trichoderma evansii]
MAWHLPAMTACSSRAFTKYEYIMHSSFSSGGRKSLPHREVARFPPPGLRFLRGTYLSTAWVSTATQLRDLGAQGARAGNVKPCAALQYHLIHSPSDPRTRTKGSGMVARKALAQRHVALLHPFWLRRRCSWISSLGDLSLLTPVPLGSSGCTRAHPCKKCKEKRRTIGKASVTKRGAPLSKRRSGYGRHFSATTLEISHDTLPTWSPMFPSELMSRCEGAQCSASVLRCGHDSRNSIVSHHQAR